MRLFCQIIALMAVLGVQPSEPLASEAEQSPRVMTRLFAAYAKFKMADYAGASEIWESIGAAGRGEAIFNLAILFEDGLGVKADMDHAMSLYRKAGVAGSRSAQYRLGRLLSEGGKIPGNRTEAIHWLRLAAGQGDTDAAALLVALEASPSGSGQDEAEQAFHNGDHGRAAQLWRHRAGQGDAHAGARLAWLYETGLGVERDLIEAERLFRISAEKGHAGAQFALAVMLRTGSGAKQKNDEALSWLRKAAAQGHPSAIAAIEEFSGDLKQQ